MTCIFSEMYAEGWHFTSAREWCEIIWTQVSSCPALFDLSIENLKFMFRYPQDGIYILACILKVIGWERLKLRRRMTMWNDMKSVWPLYDLWPWSYKSFCKFVLAFITKWNQWEAFILTSCTELWTFELKLLDDGHNICLHFKGNWSRKTQTKRNDKPWAENVMRLLWCWWPATLNLRVFFFQNWVLASIIQRQMQIAEFLTIDRVWVNVVRLTLTFSL